MSWLLGLAISLTRAWTATYTRGLPRDVRAERREEIDCDLWEHQRLAELGRETVTGTATHIMLRLILGAPEDILWRIEASSSTQMNRRIPVNDTRFMRIAFLLALLPPAILAANGIGMLLGGGDFETRTEQLLYGFGITGLSAVAIFGLWLSRSHARLGLALVTAGTGAICALLYWMLVISVPIGLAIIVIAAFRGGLLRWPMSRVRPA